jgi:hypothetical protein
MAHGDAREWKWRGHWRMEWVASTIHTTSKHGVSSITTADAHTSAASSRLKWRPRPFKKTCPFRRKTKSGFSACAITFQTQSTTVKNTWRYIIIPHRLVFMAWCFIKGRDKSLLYNRYPDQWRFKVIAVQCLPLYGFLNSIYTYIYTIGPSGRRIG